MTQLKKILCLSILFSTSITYSKEIKKEIDPWRFIEYQLITKPKSLDKKSHGLRLIPASITGTAMAIYSPKGLDYLPDEYKIEISEKTQTYAQGIAAALGASFVYGIVDSLVQYRVDRQAITTFIRQWPEFKKYTPEQLQPLFDDLYNSYLFDPRSPKYRHNALDALTIARNHVYRQFPETYGHLCKKRGFVNRSKRMLGRIFSLAPFKMIHSTCRLLV